MFEHKVIQNLDDYFIPLHERKEKGIYFYRITEYNEEIKRFIQKYYEAARISGVIIEGKIPNPDENNLSYYSEIMGMSFQMSVGFFGFSLKKWLPRMNDYQREQVAIALYDILDAIRREGKNENILKNAYIKFMCWLYYKFERIVNQLGADKLPKILYEGSISNYELKLLTILACAGCDVVLLQYHGDEGYLTLDPESKLSNKLKIKGGTPFPENFSIQLLQKEIKEQESLEHRYGTRAQIEGCVNIWNEKKGLEDIQKSILSRGDEKHKFYNCFFRIYGVEDKTTYLNALYQFWLEMNNSKRNIVIVEQSIPKPSVEEIQSISRKQYESQREMLLDLAKNIQYFANSDLEILIKREFVDIMSEKSKIQGMNLNKTTNKAIYLLCWLKRYQSALFQNWKMPEISCFIYFGGCQDENESLFLSFLSRLPIDVLILNPDLNTVCCLEDKNLYEIRYDNSLTVHKFPKEEGCISMGTAAYHAERELDTILYQDSGMYRNQQYQKANAVVLRTMYEEITLLWDQEVKYRPNFSVVNDIVNIPVICSKVSGVKNGMISNYWLDIKNLITEETIVIDKIPLIGATDPNPMKAYATTFFKNGKLQREKIKEHPAYPYGILRTEIQDHILDKLQLLIEKKMILGTFENGTEYTMISTVLNLDKKILRMIQKFDFTKKNPKIIYINTTEKIISLEDSILIAFLNAIGFDILFFIPTGYQNIEKYFRTPIMEEHQIGEYLYDLQIPRFDSITSSFGKSWKERIFGKGR